MARGGPSAGGGTWSPSRRSARSILLASPGTVAGSCGWTTSVGYPRTSSRLLGRAALASLPVVAERRHREVLARVGAGGRVTVLDYAASALADDLFADADHLNVEGAHLVSTWVGEAVSSKSYLSR